MKSINDLWVEMLISEGIAPTANKSINDLLYEMLAAGQLGRKGGLPKTGQTVEYQSGDDGTYQKGAPASGDRFTDNGDGTIKDNATGLIWIKDPSELGGVWGTPGSPSTMNWSDAIVNCEALVYAGHSDWRLPNIKELQSIVDYGAVAPAIDGTKFPNCQSDGYWSGTTYAVNSDLAWFVYFLNGYVGSDDKTYEYYVRPVRSSQ